MPRSTREWALRKLTSANNNIEWSQKHLIEVASKYTEHHPDIAKKLLVCMDLMAILQKTVRGVKSEI